MWDSWDIQILPKCYRIPQIWKWYPPQIKAKNIPYLDQKNGNNLLTSFPDIKFFIQITFSKKKRVNIGNTIVVKYPKLIV